MKKPENYMSAKKPKPTELIECWGKRWGCENQGTEWYQICDSHKSPTPYPQKGQKPDYWVCACPNHFPLGTNQKRIISR